MMEKMANAVKKVLKETEGLQDKMGKQVHKALRVIQVYKDQEVIVVRRATKALGAKREELAPLVSQV